MGKRVLFLLILFAAISSPLLYGQSSTINHGSQLERAGFTRFNVAGQKFSFRDANKFIRDSETVDAIRKGLTFEKTAIGLGVSGAVLFAAGWPMTLSGLFDFPNNHKTLSTVGTVTWILGSAMMATSIGLGIAGSVTTKKAVSRYNSKMAAGYYPTEIRLGLAATPGGLGFQMTF